MPKIKLTKNELKHQRDSLKMFERYLPTLQLKKQQLQMEVRHIREALAKDRQLLQETEARNAREHALLALPEATELPKYLKVREFSATTRNVAGIDIPVFEEMAFEQPDYDLFSTPPWFDDLLELMRETVSATLRIELQEEGLERLEQELRTVSQRVNLFEKVKIPEARENIRRINIYIGDQQTNSVGRSKIAKAKCELRDASLNV